MFILLFVSSSFLSVSKAKQINLKPNQNLQKAINSSQNGDVIYLSDSNYNGNIIINKQITITGTHLSKVIGSDDGNTIKVDADNVVIKNITILNSGDDLSKQHSGIFINKNIKNTQIINNYLDNNLISIYFWGSINSIAKGNYIIGKKFDRVNDRGNGIQVWNSPGSIIENNFISFGRDGIFTTTSKNNKFIGNYFENVRYSIHYMYTRDSLVSDNYSINNKIGYALMFSDNIIAQNNISINDTERGIFSNFMNKSTVENNIVLGSTEKCLMLYNSNYNKIAGNYFEGCNIGIHYTAGSQDNKITQNNFINNYKQVKYIGTKNIEWSVENKGNYWSDHTAFDLNKDGVADSVYHPNSITDQILWKNPNTKVLLNSPAIHLLKWSQSHFPTLYPGGIQDSYPLLKPNKKIDYKTIINYKFKQNGK